MTKPTLAAACLVLLVLSSCANTAYGLKRDGQDASAAMDDASNRVLTAGGKK
ncbi:putative small secreted protein [Pararhizobium capsulatum DSM 1112]|uniref:Small secreted protein n=1 Tax=Pararhizobium capsulatum DSM 1112 TaxID=1121113 RepID=A0ABU0BLJ5_9HYPH|nr:entericidin [Pararhizobium capsulatum]MDQ0319107.1 putative small secreted protein [Pararhizobium capsulatum DSM 1112]